MIIFNREIHVIKRLTAWNSMFLLESCKCRNMWQKVRSMEGATRDEAKQVVPEATCKEKHIDFLFGPSSNTVLLSR